MSAFYNQTAVLHTMARMLGIQPLNQMDSVAPLMPGCFVQTPGYTPYPEHLAGAYGLGLEALSLLLGGRGED